MGTLALFVEVEEAIMSSQQIGRSPLLTSRASMMLVVVSAVGDRDEELLLLKNPASEI